MQKFQNDFKFGTTGDKTIDGSINVGSRSNANASLNDFNMLGSSTNTFDSYTNGTYNDVKSFLRITTSRVEHLGGKWYGFLNGYGSFRYKNHGFVTFNTATTSDTEKKLVLTGGFYLVEKVNGTGTIKYKKEVDKSKNKTLDKENFDEYFPKPHWYTKKGGFDKYYRSNGRFIKAAGDLDNICTNTGTTNKCPEKAIGSNSQTFAWEGSGGRGYDNNCGTGTEMGGCDFVGAGSSNKEQNVGHVGGGNHMYGDDGHGLAQRLRSFKGHGRELSIPRTNVRN